MNLTGSVVEVFDTQQIKDTFKKREFVIEYAENPQYPEFIKFECIQDKCGLLDSVKVGDTIDVHFNLKGRKWTDPKGVVKYFNTLQAWKIDKAQGGGSQQPSQDMGQEHMEEPGWVSDNEEDDLPF